MRIRSLFTQLPNGYQIEVGERGVQLSAGQRQRIAITRALVKNPRILLLEEDAGSEQEMQEALHRMMVGRTTVVVAHRLSNVLNADLIAVVEKGRVVEYCTLNGLISKAEGAYSVLVLLQDLPIPSTTATRGTLIATSNFPDWK